MAKRREIRFTSLDAMLADVDRLLRGHETVGRWSLGQICNHLSTTIRLTSRGRASTEPLPPDSECLRARFFQDDRFPDGLEVPHPALSPRPDLDDHVEAETLRKAVARFESAPGPFPMHPILGPLDSTEWTRFHCIHAAHHLGFAVPL